MTPGPIAIAICLSVLSLAAPPQRAQGTTAASRIQGRVMYDSKGVSGVGIRLAESWSGIHHGLPAGEDTVTGPDGGFSFQRVNPGLNYTLIVRGFHGPNQTDLFVDVSVAQKKGESIRIDMVKPLEFTAPAYGAYLADRSVYLRWRPLGEAVRYQLRVEGPGPSGRASDLRVPASQTQAKMNLAPGMYCAYATAFNGQNVAVGGTVLPQGASYAPANHCFVVADPELERKVTVAQGVCSVRGGTVYVFVKPSRSRAEADQTSFILLAGEKAKLLGQLGDWRKVGSERGVGWVQASDLTCSK